MGGLTNDRVDYVVALLGRGPDTKPRLVRTDDDGNLLVTDTVAPTQQVASNVPTNRVSLNANTVTLLVAARANRLSLILQNLTGVDIYIGQDNTVSALTGLLLQGVVANAASLHYTGAIYGISSTPSKVAVMELY